MINPENEFYDYSSSSSSPSDSIMALLFTVCTISLTENGEKNK